MVRTYLSSFIFILLVSACGTSQSVDSKTNVSIEFVDKVVIDSEKQVDSTIVGGLSSIDFLGGNQYVVISDDRSEHSPARFYEISIDFDLKGIQQYAFLSTTFLKDKSDSLFRENEIDPEAIRYRVSTNTFFYTSEGGRVEKLVKPFIREMDRKGNFILDIHTPEIFNFYEGKGLRENGGFESLAFESDTVIWYANELPLKEDGDVPSFKDGGYPVRLVRQDIKNDKVLSQFVYDLGYLEKRPSSPDGFYINSVPEILFIKRNKLWVMERSYTEGVGNSVKIFEIDTQNATDYKNTAALTNMEYSAVPKTMLLDFSKFKMKIDNIEGMTIGPDFEDGSKSLILISDNNFNEKQETQLWLFKF